MRMHPERRWGRARLELLGLLIAGLALGPRWTLASESKRTASGDLPGIGTLQPAGEVIVADDFEQQVGLVRRFTGLNPRQDWQHVLATRGQLVWQRFYLSPAPESLHWPKGRQLTLVLRDSVHVQSRELFVVSPDERRVPTMLARTDAALDSHDLLHHDSRTLVLYAGFPTRAGADSASRSWQFREVASIR